MKRIDYTKDKYIIAEIIPDGFTKETGKVIQISAIKLDGLKLIDRFDYRLSEDNIKIREFIEMLNYDKECFVYLDSDSEIISEFKKFIEDLPIILMDNTYSLNFINDIDNEKHLIFDYLDITYTSNSFKDMIDKYNLEESNYVVDLAYEALIFESNN